MKMISLLSFCILIGCQHGSSEIEGIDDFKSANSNTFFNSNYVENLSYYEKDSQTLRNVGSVGADNISMNNSGKSCEQKSDELQEHAALSQAVFDALGLASALDSTVTEAELASVCDEMNALQRFDDRVYQRNHPYHRLSCNYDESSPDNISCYYGYRKTQGSRTIWDSSSCSFQKEGEDLSDGEFLNGYLEYGVLEIRERDETQLKGSITGTLVYDYETRDNTDIKVDMVLEVCDLPDLEIVILY